MINAERLLDTFLRYVQIDSESGHEKVMGETLVRDVKALGLDPITDKAGETFGSDGFNVFFRFPGTLPGDPFVLSAHMDTVVPGKGIRPFIEDGIIKSGPDTILGGDDKSGICGIQSAIFSALALNQPLFSTTTRRCSAKKGIVSPAVITSSSLMSFPSKYAVFMPSPPVTFDMNRPL